MNISPGEIMLILAAVVLIGGASRIPKMARSLGQAKNEFQKGLKESENPEEAPPAAKPEHNEADPS